MEHGTSRRNIEGIQTFFFIHVLVWISLAAVVPRKNVLLATTSYKRIGRCTSWRQSPSVKCIQYLTEVTVDRYRVVSWGPSVRCLYRLRFQIPIKLHGTSDISHNPVIEHLPTVHGIPCSHPDGVKNILKRNG